MDLCLFSFPCPFLCGCGGSGLSGCCWGNFPLAPLASRWPPCRRCGGLLHGGLPGTPREAEISGWVSGAGAAQAPLPGVWALCLRQPRAGIASRHPGAMASRGTGCVAALDLRAPPRSPLRLLEQNWKRFPGEQQLRRRSAP